MKALEQKTKTNDNLILLGLQLLFACFGATVLVPAFTGLSVSSALLFAGIGTLLFHSLTKKQVPVFLGSSFAFISAYNTIAPNGDSKLLPYACIGVAFAGLVYLLLSGLFKLFGPEKVLRFLPTVVTSPIIIAIGLTLAGSALSNCATDWKVAILSLVIVVIFSIWGRGMAKIIPVLLGMVGSYAVAFAFEPAVRASVIANVAAAKWIGLPFAWSNTVFGIQNFDKAIFVSAIITIMPLAIATCSEHIGDISAISSTCNKDFIGEVGLHRTLLGDGLATILASLFGAPANTTYGESTAVVALTGKTNPKIQRVAAVFAIAFSFCPKFAALISSMPAAVIGGVSLILYGMISAVGIRNLIEQKVDLTKPRNIIIVSVILCLAVGITYGIGSVTIGIVTLSGLAVATLVGVLMNAIIPVDKPENLTFSQNYDTI